MYRRFGKRILDVTLVLCALPFLTPLIGAIGLMVAAFMGRPVVFRHRRSGLNGKPITVLKFRTMTNKTDPNGQLLPDHVRLTAVGRWLRSLSLDELPQLWNVLKGDMSLVGPRPLLPKYDPLYSPVQRRRLSAPPGITGLAQVSGRNGISWDRKLALDVEYVDKYSLLFDIRILITTVIVVFRRNGVNATSDTPMPEFAGSTVNQD